jgi:hypothetical protein
VKEDNVVYLEERYPDKVWPIQFIAAELAFAHLENNISKYNRLLKQLPKQVLIGQMYLEIAECKEEWGED